jgi:hypothetical protein
LFDSDQPDISLDQRVDQGDHFRGAATKPAQLSDNQGIGFVKQLQKFIDPALLTGFARRDRHFDKLVNLDAAFSGKFQKHLDYFVFSEQELSLALNRPTVHAQLHCTLQIGYFKAKQAFFLFSWEQIQEDTSFLRSRYFADQEFVPQPITRHEYYTQRTAIAALFGYQLWCSDFLPLLRQQAAQIVSRDVTPGFIVAEIIAFLHERKIVRPGYTTLQSLISETLSVERNRLGKLLNEMLGEADKLALQQLLVQVDTLSGLAALKQDAKHFGYDMMLMERQKRTALEPVYRLMKELLPALAISQQNLNYYANLAHSSNTHAGRNSRSMSLSRYKSLRAKNRISAVSTACWSA